MLENHLKQLQQELELTEPFPSEVPGVWSIPLEETVEVVLTQLQPEGFSLNCVIGSLPEDHQDEFLDQVMLSNLFGQGTGGAVLGIDETEKNIVLAQNVEQDLEYQKFKDLLEDFLNSVEVWRDEILEYQGKSE